MISRKYYEKWFLEDSNYKISLEAHRFSGGFLRDLYYGVFNTPHRLYGYSNYLGSTFVNYKCLDDFKPNEYFKESRKKSVKKILTRILKWVRLIVRKA